jgi:hypothetical protein
MKPIISLENSIDIILTPQFYTFIREELNYKFSYQVKSIAQSLFEGYLKSNNNYQYHVYKCDNLWCLIAYDIDEIGTFLESVGIEKHRVSKIFFAQQLIDVVEFPILLDEKSILQNIDDVITVVPKQLMDFNLEYQPLDMERLKLKGGLTMGSSLKSYVSLKQTLLLGSIFSILGGISLVEGDRIKASIAKDDAKLTALLDDNPRYASSLSRASILEKYQPIDQKERAKREAIKEISKFLSNSSQLKRLTIENNKVKAEIKTNNQTINRQVKQRAEAKGFRVSGSTLGVKVEKSL